jgi:hypothetical protein
MRIAVPGTGETFETQLEECETFETQFASVRRFGLRIQQVHGQ